VNDEAFRRALDEARSGSEPAFALLYRSLAPAIHGFARGRGAPDPEDVVAETMVSVARNLDRFRGDVAAFRSWAFTIAYRRVVDDRRRASRRVAVRPMSGTEDWPSAAGVADAIVDGLASEPVLDALRRLGAEQRDVVLLRVLGDLPVREVAEIMGKREGAVKMIHARALSQLRRDLAPAFAGTGDETAVVGGHDG
jgi:RNA polymerase sigma factor (sigma-70 family)